MGILERVLVHWKTSSAGVVGAGILLYVFNSLHCQVPTQTQLLAMIPAIIGLLAKDH